jgi:hypothetical protein
MSNFGWINENKGMTCLTTKEKKIRRATLYALAGIGILRKQGGKRERGSGWKRGGEQG